MEHKVVLTAGGDIHYRTCGTGIPVLLLHGFAEDSSIWNGMLELLGEYYFFIIPDLPGTGQSGYLRHENVGLDDYAEGLHELMLQEKAGRFVLIGHSMGGYIALAYTEKFPAQVSALGLYHSSAAADDEEKIASRRKGIDFIRTHGPLEFLRSTVPGLFFDQEKNRHEIKLLIQKGDQFTADTLIQYYEAMINRPERLHVLTHFHGAVGFFIGEHDKAVPFKLSMHQCHLPQESMVYIMRDSAHMSMVEEKHTAFENMASFLDHSSYSF